MFGSSLLSLAVVALACSDDGLAGADGAAASTTSGGSTTDDNANDGTGQASAAEPTSAEGTIGGPSADSSGTGEASTSTGGTSTTDPGDSTGATEESTGTTGGQGNVVYSAIAIPGGLDRIRINKANLDDDRCTWVVLVAPDIPSTYPGLTVPAGWSVESVSINDVAVACDSDNPAMFGFEAALDANGSIEFGMLGGGGLYPCMVDIDATFDFQGMLPGIPPTDAMLAIDIPVTGC